MVPFAVTADIGADHGKLIISLFENNKIPHGYAVENKKGPYNRLVKALEERCLEEDIVPLFSDGITDIPESVSTLIIAGMGGGLIIDILKAHPEKLKYVDTIIVDPHNQIPEVREYLSSIGFIIAEEKMVKEDGIYYEIIKFLKGDIAYLSDKDIEFGPLLRNEKSAAFREKYSSRIDQINHLLQNKSLPEEKVNSLINERTRIENVL